MAGAGGDGWRRQASPDVWLPPVLGGEVARLFCDLLEWLLRAPG